MKTITPALMSELASTAERVLIPENLQELRKIANGDPYKFLDYVFALGYICAADTVSGRQK